MMVLPNPTGMILRSSCYATLHDTRLDRSGLGHTRPTLTPSRVSDYRADCRSQNSSVTQSRAQAQAVAPRRATSLSLSLSLSLYIYIERESINIYIYIYVTYKYIYIYICICTSNICHYHECSYDYHL